MKKKHVRGSFATYTDGSKIAKCDLVKLAKAYSSIGNIPQKISLNRATEIALLAREFLGLYAFYKKGSVPKDGFGVGAVWECKRKEGFPNLTFTILGTAISDPKAAAYICRVECHGGKQDVWEQTYTKEHIKTYCTRKEEEHAKVQEKTA